MSKPEIITLTDEIISVGLRHRTITETLTLTRRDDPGAYALTEYEVRDGSGALIGTVGRYKCQRERRIRGARYVAARWDSTQWCATPTYEMTKKGERTWRDTGTRKRAVLALIEMRERIASAA